MMPLGHAIVSSAVAGAVYLASSDWRMALVAWLVGVGVDLDHIPEFTILRGHRFRLREFLRYCAESRMKKMYLLLHAYEYVLVIALLAWILDLPRWGMVVGLAFLSHLVADQLSNPVRPLAYFIINRYRQGFDVGAVIDPDSPILAARRARYAARASRSRKLRKPTYVATNR